MIGVDVYDHKNRVNRKFFAPLVVNAGGIWGQGIAEYADLKIKMFPAKVHYLLWVTVSIKW